MKHLVLYKVGQRVQLVVLNMEGCFLSLKNFSFNLQLYILKELGSKLNKNFPLKIHTIAR